MGPILNWITSFLKRHLGLHRRLPEKAKTLVWMIAFYDFSFALSSVFINIYLFKGHDDLTIPGWFNFASYVAIVMAFVIGAHLSVKWNHLLPYQMGLIFNASVFLIVLLERENTLGYPAFLGALYGLGIGFYYLGQHSLTLDLTETKTRDHVLSIQLFLSSNFRILAPAMAGWTIVLYRSSSSFLGWVDDGASAGYYLVFALSLAINIGLIVKSLQFEDKSIRKGIHLWKVLTFEGNLDWNRQMWIQFILGLRNGVFWFVIGLLVYRVSHNEGIVGTYNMLSNLIAVLTGYSLSRWATRENRYAGLWISSALICTASLLLSWQVGAFTLLAFAVFNMIGTSWFQVVFSAIGFEIMEKAVEYRKHQLEYLAVRELPLGIGRLIGLSFLMLAQGRMGEDGLRLTFLVLGLIQMTVLFFVPKEKRKGTKLHLAEMEVENYTR